jgi:adenine/guanine phosphoribosyltransferase-like PRPP-binding protein
MALAEMIDSLTGQPLQVIDPVTGGSVDAFDPIKEHTFDVLSQVTEQNKIDYQTMITQVHSLSTSGVVPAASVADTIGPTGIVRRSPPSTRTVVSPIVAAVKAPDYSLVVIAVAAVAVAFVGRVLLSR